MPITVYEKYYLNPEMEDITVLISYRGKRECSSPRLLSTEAELQGELCERHLNNVNVVNFEVEVAIIIRSTESS